MPPSSFVLKGVINPKQLVLVVGDCGVFVSGLGVELCKNLSLQLAIHCNFMIHCFSHF